MFRLFTQRKTHRWLEALPDLLAAYNASVHRVIGMKPKDVKIEHEEYLWDKLYGKEFPKKAIFRFQIGDVVRIARIPTSLFEKGSTVKWTEENFVVAHRRATEPPTYKLHDLQQELIKGSFYEHQMQKIEMPTDEQTYHVDILKRRKRKGKLQFFVHYRGWPSSFDEWVDKGQVTSLT
ncbi:uncharacterized protein LOC135489926 [Lineus longissimus]|uniref:uncharacterized protein LOC135489926 n=1 Tax=Lineus longissimus TaxID=88925 RepID=UPI00315D33CA